MAHTATTFVAEYPEFAALNEEDTALVAAYLARAERRIGSAWPAAVRDDIVALQCAHMLALSPWGRNARMSDASGASAYGDDLALRKKGFACARSRVVGEVAE
jgi:hypothetical protein